MSDETTDDVLMSPAEGRVAAESLFGDLTVTPAQRRLDQARQLIGSDVARIIRGDAEHAGESMDDRYEVRPMYPGAKSYPSLDTRPVWRYQLQAGLSLVQAAKTEVRSALDVARGQGAPWGEIAVWLGYTGKLTDPDGDPMDPGYAAWRFAATGRGPGERVNWASYGYNDRAQVTWRCWTCTKSVRESDPENGVDAQEGHAEGCARFAEEKAAQRARWED